MVYVRKFSLPSEGQELRFLADNRESQAHLLRSRYPFGVFLSRDGAAAGIDWSRSPSCAGATAAARPPS